MSDPGSHGESSRTGLEKPVAPSPTPEEDDTTDSRAPSLALLYGLLAFALALAIALAALILRPFHLGR
jgi:hypothetical protein